MKEATVYFNDKYIEVISWIDGGISVFNYDFTPILLPVDISNIILGDSIKKALEANFKIPAEQVNDYLFSPIWSEKDQERQKKLMQTYGYKTKKSLFKNMRSVSITLSDKILVSPSHQDGLDFSFLGLEQSNDLILNKNATDEEIGVAARKAMSLCTSIYK